MSSDALRLRSGYGSNAQSGAPRARIARVAGRDARFRRCSPFACVEGNAVPRLKRQGLHLRGYVVEIVGSVRNEPDALDLFAGAVRSVAGKQEAAAQDRAT